MEPHMQLLSKMAKLLKTLNFMGVVIFVLGPDRAAFSRSSGFQPGYSITGYGIDMQNLKKEVFGT
jgi:hypothetical protein